LRAFCADLALPSSVFGPRDLAPFLRLASARAWLIWATRGDCPVGSGNPALDMRDSLLDGGWLEVRAGWRVMAEARNGGLREPAV
jgi:hypothetical protein